MTPPPPGTPGPGYTPDFPAMPGPGYARGASTPAPRVFQGTVLFTIVIKGIQKWFCGQVFWGEGLGYQGQTTTNFPEKNGF